MIARRYSVRQFRLLLSGDGSRMRASDVDAELSTIRVSGWVYEVLTKQCETLCPIRLRRMVLSQSPFNFSYPDVAGRFVVLVSDLSSQW